MVMKIGLISNALSQRNKRALPRTPESLPRGVELLHRPLDGIDGLAGVLDDFAADAAVRPHGAAIPGSLAARACCAGSGHC